MKPLLELLHDKKIVHPSKIIAVTISKNGIIKLELEGYPWWISSQSEKDTGNITFIFEGCYDGFLSLEDLTLDHNEDLEYFHIEKYQNTVFATEAEHSIFCNSPINDPMKILRLTHDFLINQHMQPILYEHLNFGHHNSTENFLQIVKSKCFLLSRCTDQLKDILVAELHNQRVPFLIESHAPSRKPNYLVSLGTTQFFCEEAWVE